MATHPPDYTPLGILTVREPRTTDRWLLGRSPPLIFCLVCLSLHSMVRASHSGQDGCSRARMSFVLSAGSARGNSQVMFTCRTDHPLSTKSISWCLMASRSQDQDKPLSLWLEVCPLNPHLLHPHVRQPKRTKKVRERSKTTYETVRKGSGWLFLFGWPCSGCQQKVCPCSLSNSPHRRVKFR